MLKWNTEVEGHFIEFMTGSTGSIDPWSLAYAVENDIKLWISDDMMDYVRIDNSVIYKFERCSAYVLVDMIKNGELNTFKEVDDWLMTNCKQCLTYLEMVEILNKRRR